MKASFSSREVATLVESLKSEFKTVSENVSSLLGLKEVVTELTGEVQEVKTRLELLELAVRSEFPAIKSRLAKLEVD